MDITYHNATLWSDDDANQIIVMASNIIDNPNSNILVAFKHSNIERAFWENKFWDAYWGPSDMIGFTCVILKPNTSKELEEAYGTIGNIR